MVFLLDMLAHLGDVLMVTPAVAELKAKNPGCKTIAMVQPQVADILLNIECLFAYDDLVDMRESAVSGHS